MAQQKIEEIIKEMKLIEQWFLDNKSGPWEAFYIKLNAHTKLLNQAEAIFYAE